MQDKFGRTIDYMRISITDRCNLRCVYCMAEEQQQFLPESELLTIEEWERLCQGAAQAGIRKIRITGGEPLMRPDAVSLVHKISQIPNIEKVVMTSNGVGLAKVAKKLKLAGLAGVNISIDSLERESYCRLTGRDVLAEALEGLSACGSVGLPVKVNCVPVVGENEAALWQLAELAKQYPIEVRFIEMMPLGEGAKFQPIANDKILQQFQERYGDFVQQEPDKKDGPAIYYQNAAFCGNIGLISPMSHSFCHQCNRIRVTADGKLKLCLHHPADLDLRALLRAGNQAEQIKTILQEAVQQKPKDGHSTDESRPMWRIGG